jgi:hypothetical protein
VRRYRIRLPTSTYARKRALRRVRVSIASPPLCAGNALANRVLASPPSLHQHYPASQVLCSDPTSPPPFASLAASACRAYSFPRAVRISLVAAMTGCQTRSGLRPRVSVQHSPVAHCPVLPSAQPRASARSVSYTISGLNPVHGRDVSSAIRPRLLSVYASTRLLPDALQHSIRGGGLDLTPAGFAPACHDTISRTHRPARVDGSSSLQCACVFLHSAICIMLAASGTSIASPWTHAFFQGASAGGGSYAMSNPNVFGPSMTASTVTSVGSL